MSKPPHLQPSVDEGHMLRQRAEAHFAERVAHHPASLTARTPEATQQLLHELQVHQIELEMQNDELRRAQVALDRSQALFFDFYDMAPVGYCTVNAEGLVSQANITMASLLGVTRDKLILQDIHRFIQQEDQDSFYLFRKQLLKSGDSMVIELRMHRADDALFWASVAAMAVPNDSGARTLRMVISDITTRKQAADQLQQAASVFRHAGEGIMVTDALGNLTEVNEAFCRITGYDIADVLGKNPRLLKSGRQGPDFYAKMWHELTGCGYWRGEIWNQRKNGEAYAEMLTISAVRDAHGEVQRYVGLFFDITTIKSHEQQLEHMAYFDALTGLPNRALKADRLRQAMALARRSRSNLAVVYIDLDGFKKINDSFGHEAGDLLLVDIANRMQMELREGDTLARLGGDEFVAVLVNLESVAASLPLLDRLVEAAAQAMTYREQRIQVSASLGVTFYPQAQDIEADQLLRQADQAMYQAKQAGKNRYQLFDSKQEASLRDRRDDLGRVRHALLNHEFILYYQPKVNMRSGQLVGAEALIRWQHPTRGLMPPDAFLPIFEDHPLAVDVGEWVIDTALSQIETWQAQGLQLPVSVNVGAHQLQQPDFVLRLTALLARHPQVRPQDLELEILETSALQDVVYVAQLIETCRKMGVKFALDDFGTGYSSLTYLRRLRVALLKIDQSFVRGVLEEPDDKAILAGIIRLASAFRCAVIAEGVETIAHGTLLLQMGCELAQGFGISRPMPAADLPDWAASWQPDAAWRGVVSQI